MYKPFHLIGMELNVSILSAALDGKPTGSTKAFTGDVVATAKRNLVAGETLDGEGGYCVWGKLIPAATSVALGALPIGLAQDVMLTRSVKQGQVVTYDDIRLPDADPVFTYRRAMEATLHGR